MIVNLVCALACVLLYFLKIAIALQMDLLHLKCPEKVSACTILARPGNVSGDITSCNHTGA